MCGGKFVKRGSFHRLSEFLSLSPAPSLSLALCSSAFLLLTKEELLQQLNLKCCALVCVCECVMERCRRSLRQYLFRWVNATCLSDRDSHSAQPTAWLVPIRQPVTFPLARSRRPGTHPVLSASRLEQRTTCAKESAVIATSLGDYFWKRERRRRRGREQERERGGNRKNTKEV